MPITITIPDAREEHVAVTVHGERGHQKLVIGGHDLSDTSGMTLVPAGCDALPLMIALARAARAAVLREIESRQAQAADARRRAELLDESTADLDHDDYAQPEPYEEPARIVRAPLNSTSTTEEHRA